MSTNYWIEQHNKELLSLEIKKYLDDIHGGVYDPNMAQELAKEIAAYLKKQGKTQYKVYVRLALETGELTIEIP
jgi:hypothetical protein